MLGASNLQIMSGRINKGQKHWQKQKNKVKRFSKTVKSLLTIHSI